MGYSQDGPIGLPEMVTPHTTFCTRKEEEMGGRIMKRKLRAFKASRCPDSADNRYLVPEFRSL
jgi:hypothetical protein